MIYEPREDSFLLQTYVRQYARGNVLDMGTGSGIQALTAKEKGADVLAVDSNPEAVQWVKTLGINAVVSDLFQTVTGKFDCIIFNPPYLPKIEHEEWEVERMVAGGKQGHELIERFLAAAKKHLKKKGTILLITSSLTGNIPSLLKKYKYDYAVLEEKKIPFETLTVYLVQQ
jgi:release factor glutamine methyltransferase